MFYVANCVAGTAFVYVDTAPLPLAGTITVSTWDAEKDTKTGLSGVVGYSEMPVAPFIEVEIFVTPGVNLQAFQNVRDAVVVAELANGQTWTLRGAWCTKAPEHNGAEGTATLRFESKRKAEKS